MSFQGQSRHVAGQRIPNDKYLRRESYLGIFPRKVYEVCLTYKFEICEVREIDQLHFLYQVQRSSSQSELLT